jgi:hypothetical protein
MSSIEPPPTLTKIYSGIPERLLDKATSLKHEVTALTTGSVVPRTENVELPIIPAGYSRSRFNSAIEAIELLIGRQNVELNIQPLVDGWSAKLYENIPGIAMID